jgi:hypothetical protein
MNRDSEDKDSRQPASKPDNPFIKFRQFADEQISSLLQGIIGLPSALSKAPGNGRWAHFDDELRRRDELQARQKELNEREARKVGTQNIGGDENAEISVKTFSGWPKRTPSDSEHTENNRQTDHQEERDLPLYSPVSKSLFAHLKDTGELKDSANWHPIGTASLPFTMIRTDQIFPYPMRAIRHVMFTELNSTPQFRSEFSLLPYLLFSPYSPLKLSLARWDNARGESEVLDNFPYCDAFEDLILASQGRPMPPYSSAMSFFDVGIERYVGSAINWIVGLKDGQTLQQKEERTEQAKPLGPLLEELALFKPGKMFQFETSSGSPQTEEEMYQRFLGLASPAADSRGRPSRDSLESILEDMEEEFKNSTASHSQEFMQEVRKIAKEFRDMRAQQTFEDELPKTVRPSVLKAWEARMEKMEKVDLKGSEDKKATSSSDKVVFTSTTTEHTTDEDGSVETSVTVHKRFADGRETVTTTKHTEDPARDEEGNIVERYPADRTQEIEKQDKKKETGKKGWFWN